MTLNGIMALILSHFTEFDSFRDAQCDSVYDVVVKSSRSLSHLLMSFLFRYASGQTNKQTHRHAQSSRYFALLPWGKVITERHSE